LRTRGFRGGAGARHLAYIVGVFTALAGVFGLPAEAAGLAVLPGTLEPMPADVSAHLGLFGLVYADARGMTLYWDDADHDPGVSTCGDAHLTTAYNGNTHFGYPLPYPYQGVDRRTCTQKWPPFEPAANAVAVGKWTISTRSDGRRQWAYEGKPLYLSILDRMPGDVNAVETRIRSRQPLYAPLYMPNGIRLMPTVLGIALANRAGYTLYTYRRDTRDRSLCDKDCARIWLPVIAAAGSLPEAPWSTIRREDGQRQLTYEGHPLYQYSADEGPAYVSGSSVADWSPIVLLAPPTPPEHIRTETTVLGPVYVDRNGMSLYQFTCNEENDEHLSCDREGDTGAYFHGLCGGEARCANTFRLLRVTDPGARDGPLWTIRSVDLTNPLRVLADPSQGTRVWLYKRRLVFTYSGDTAPGQFYAHGLRQLILSEIDVLKAYGAPDQKYN
jgi:predicted lipoprotein with Yx(FWY)xxD motif